MELSASQLSTHSYDTILSGKRGEVQTALRRAQEVEGRTNPTEFAKVISSISSFVAAISDFEDFIFFGIADDRTSYIAETSAAMHAMNEILRTDIQDGLFLRFREIYQCYFLRRKSTVDRIKHAASQTSKVTGDVFEILNYLQDVTLTFGHSHDDGHLKWDSSLGLLEKAIVLLNESGQVMDFYSSRLSNVDGQAPSGVENSQSANCTLPRHVFARMSTTRMCVNMHASIYRQISQTRRFIENNLADMKVISTFIHENTNMESITGTNITLPETNDLPVEYAENNTALRVKFAAPDVSWYYQYLEKMRRYLDCFSSYESSLDDISEFLGSVTRPINLGINYEVDHLLEHAARVRSWLEGQIIRYARNETTKELLAQEFSIHVGDLMATSEAISKETQQFIIAPLQALIRQEQTEIANLYVRGLEMFLELVAHIDNTELRQRPRSMSIWKGPLPDPGSSQVRIVAGAKITVNFFCVLCEPSSIICLFQNVCQ